MLKLHQQAPHFNLAGTDGKFYQPSVLKGKLVVLYFYPRDNTPGCTQEACDFRDNFSRIAKKNCKVFGISKDSIESHKKFIDKHELNFVLLSDPELQAHTAYEVLEGEKAIRSTFLIDKEGKIAKIWSKVSVKNHVEEILEAIEEIK